MTCHGLARSASPGLHLPDPRDTQLSAEAAAPDQSWRGRRPTRDQLLDEPSPPVWDRADLLAEASALRAGHRAARDLADRIEALIRGL